MNTLSYTFAECCPGGTRPEPFGDAFGGADLQFILVESVRAATYTKMCRRRTFLFSELWINKPGGVQPEGGLFKRQLLLNLTFSLVPVLAWGGGY